MSNIKNNFLINLMIFLLIFDPKSSFFKLSELTFLLLIVNFLKKPLKLKKESLYFYLSYFLFPVIYGGIVTLFLYNQNYNIYYIKQNIIRVLFAGIIFLLDNYSVENIKKIFINTLKRYSIFLSFIWIMGLILNLTHQNEIKSLVYWFGRNKNIFLLHYMKIGIIEIPSVFSDTLLLLVFLLSFSVFKEKDNKYKVLSFFLLIQSGTMANLLSGILIIGYYIFSKILKKNSLSIKLIFFSLSNIFFLLLFKGIIFSSEDIGKNIKKMHLLSYITYWKNEPLRMITGEGIGSAFYTSAYHKIVYQTEIFYFEILRIYGVFFFSIIILLLFYIVILLIKNLKEEWLISFLAYLFISGTNPYLFGIVGSFIVSVIYKIAKEKCLPYYERRKMSKK